MATNSTDATASGPVFRRLVPGDFAEACRFFAAIREDPDRARFRPHGFDDENARRVTGHAGADLYAGAFNGSRMIAYGMLRGWNEGHTVPSLGIYVHRDFRGRGAGRWMLERLHASAAELGATSVRLTVDRDNRGAVRLYEAIGYIFGPLDTERLVGVRPLP